MDWVITCPAMKSIRCRTTLSTLKSVTPPPRYFVESIVNQSFYIAHWDHFRHFMALLNPACSDSTADCLELPHPRSSRMRSTINFEQSKLANWLSSDGTDGRILKVTLMDQIDPVEVLVLITRAIQKCTETQWNSFPAINTDNSQGKTTKADVYVQLLQQIATQQPRVFLHMQHLMPTLTDAIRSHIRSWRERCLWLCLKTVMHAPVGIATYGFLHINTIAAVEAVRSINSCLRDTDSKFKLVTAFADDSQLNIDDSRHFNLDLTLTMKGVGAVHLYPFPTPESLSPQTLWSSIRPLGKPIFNMLMWIAFAMRPLSVEDLDLVLALGEGEPNRGSETFDVRHAPAAYLQKSIPEITEISRGRISLRVPYPNMRRASSRFALEDHDTAASAHFYLSQSCFSFLVTHIFKFCKGEGASYSGAVSDKTEGKFNAAQNTAQNISSKQHQQGSHKVVIDEIPAPLRGLAKYAAQNWITHYRLAVTIPQSAEREILEPLSSIVKNRAYVCQWLHLVEHFSSPLYQSKGIDYVDVELVQSHLSSHTLVNLETLYQIASHPLPLSWLGRLLIHAAELGDKATITSLCSSLDAIEPEAISRALATTDSDIHEVLKTSAMSILKDEYWKMIAQAHLTSQVLGNVAMSNNLLDELLSRTTWLGKEAWFSNALDRAVEYDEQKALEKLLSTQDGRKYIASQGAKPRWTPIHRAAYYGSLECMSKIWKAGLPLTLLNIFSPDGRRALFISSARGFGFITRFLALSGVPVNSRNGKYEQMALHAAGFYGHWKTTKTLLDNGADVTAVDSKGNFSVHLAIHQSHSHVAALTIGHFPPLLDAHGPSGHVENTASQSTNPHFLTDEEATTLYEYYRRGTPIEEYDIHSQLHRYSLLYGRPLCLLDRANFEGVSALFYAAERDFPVLAKALLGRGVDPDTMDHYARTALYFAAKSGRADLIKELIAHGATTNQTFQLLGSIPLHDACYRGHADAIQSLSVNASDLLLEDS